MSVTLYHPPSQRLPHYILHPDDVCHLFPFVLPSFNYHLIPDLVRVSHRIPNFIRVCRLIPDLISLGFVVYPSPYQGCRRIHHLVVVCRLISPLAWGLSSYYSIFMLGFVVLSLYIPVRVCCLIPLYSCQGLSSYPSPCQGLSSYFFAVKRSNHPLITG